MYIPVNSGMENEKSSIFSLHDWSMYEKLKFNISEQTTELRDGMEVLKNQWGSPT